MGHWLLTLTALDEDAVGMARGGESAALVEGEHGCGGGGGGGLDDPSAVRGWCWLAAWMALGWVVEEAAEESEDEWAGEAEKRDEDEGADEGADEQLLGGRASAGAAVEAGAREREPVRGVARSWSSGSGMGSWVEASRRRGGQGRGRGTGPGQLELQSRRANDRGWMPQRAGDRRTEDGSKARRSDNASSRAGSGVKGRAFHVKGRR